MDTVNVRLKRIPPNLDGSFDVPARPVGYSGDYHEGIPTPTHAIFQRVPIVHVEISPISFDDPGTARAVWIIQEEE